MKSPCRYESLPFHRSPESQRQCRAVGTRTFPIPQIASSSSHLGRAVLSGRSGSRGFLDVSPHTVLALLAVAAAECYRTEWRRVLFLP